MILEPLLLTEINDVNSKNLIKITEDLVKRIRNNNLEDRFDFFLLQLNLNEEQYIYALRSSLKRVKVFLKRPLNSILVNNYNTEILYLHQSNMDIQFILNPYSCVEYILTYILLLISLLLRKAKEDIKGGNSTLKDQLKYIANKFVNATEVSAQEAVYVILGLKISQSSRMNIFINTSLPENRTHLVKSREQLMKIAMIDSGSKNIFQSDLITHYTLRPYILEDYCLADFASKLNLSKYKTAKSENNNSDENEDNEDNEDNEENDIDTEIKFPVITELLDNSRYIHFRKFSKIIRYPNTDISKDETNHYREQIMLFFPWRNEINFFKNKDFKSFYLKNLDIIKKNKLEYCYEHDENILAEIEENIVKNLLNLNENLIATENKIDPEYAILNRDDTEFDNLENELDIRAHKNSTQTVKM